MSSASWSRFPLRRIKMVAQVKPSNVDKLSTEGHATVQLCNYVDVYRNDRITGDLPFMGATATDSQISEFSLQTGDVVITKDSETPDDIASPALVEASASGVVCGYHLAILRPEQIVGSYLFYALQAKPVREQFSCNAKGVTRFGITINGIGSVLIPLPSEAKQRSIVRFLDSETTRIDALIGAKLRMLELLTQQLSTKTIQLLTRGTRGSTVSSTGLDAIPEAPSHWQIRRLATLFRESTSTGEPTLPVLSITISAGITDRELGDEDRARVVNRIEDRSAYKVVQPGDLAYNMMRAWQGALGVSKVPGAVSPAYVVARPIVPMHSPYFEALLRTPMFIEEMRRASKGIADFRQRLYWQDFRRIQIPLPPQDEQFEIYEAVAKATADFQDRDRQIRRSIDLLRERRSALISAAVLGQLDARSDACIPETSTTDLAA